MKHGLRMPVVLAAACAAAAACGRGRSADARAGSEVVLVADGQPRAEVVLPPGSVPVARWAAGELVRVIGKSTGVEPPVVAEPTGERVAIYVGDSPAVRDLGIDPTKLEREEIRVLVRSGSPGVVAIAGRDDPEVEPEKGLAVRGMWTLYFERGTVFAVHEFLERVVGARWYWPGQTGEVVPRHETLKTREMDLDVRPHYPERLIAVTKSPENKRWLFRVRYSTYHKPNLHGFKRLGLRERFGETHPEYFALLPDGTRDVDPTRRRHVGHLTYSNPAIAEEIAQDAISFFRGEPASKRGVWYFAYGRRHDNWNIGGFHNGWFSLMPQDGVAFSEEPGDKRWWSQGEQGKSEMVWRFIRRIVDRVHAEGITNAKWTASAYSYYRLVPKTVEIPKNMHIRCCFGGPYEIIFGRMKEHKALIRAWYEKLGGRKVGLSGYMTTIRDGVPPFAYDAIGRYYRELKDYCDGMHNYHRADNTMLNHVNWYMAARVAWDPSLEPRAIMEEFFDKAFGPAREPMKAYYEEMQELWTGKMLRNLVDTPLGPQMVIPNVPDMWEHIYTQEVIDRNEQRFDQAEKLAAGDADVLARVRHVRKTIFDETKAERKKFMKGLEAVGRPVVHAAPAEGKIAVDGRLDDRGWKAAEVHRMGTNVQNVDPFVPTEFSVVRTADALIVGADCREPEARRLRRTKLGHDDKNRWQEASVEIFLAPVEDPAGTYFQVIVDTHGGITDWKRGAGGTGDRNWESGTTAAARVGPDGWTLEARLPLAALGEFAGLDEFRFNLCRNRQISGGAGDENQHYTWSPLLKGAFQQPWAFGFLKLVDRLPDPDEGTIVKNGSFERIDPSGAPEWWGRSLPKGAWALDRENARLGRYCVKLTGSEKKRVSIRKFLDPTEFRPDTEYVFGFWLKTEGVSADPALKESTRRTAGCCGIRLWLDGNQWYPVPSVSGTTAWRPYAYRFRTPKEPLRRACFDLRVWDASGTAWYDGVSLRQAAE